MNGMSIPKINLAAPPPPRRRWKKILFAAGGGLLVWQGLAGSIKTPSAPTLPPLTPLALVGRVTRYVAGSTGISGDRDRTNVLLLGIGGAGHDGPYLTDTIMLLSAKTSTRETAFISIPRDLIVSVPRYGFRKINHANALAEADRPGSGGDMARETVAAAFGVRVPYVVRVDFTGFERLIDSLGGITIAVERSFSDAQFPNDDGTVTTVSFSRGIQNMDGKTALIYARSRHGSDGEGSDFARGRRQQQVLLAIADRILSADVLTSPLKLKAVWDTLSAHLQTNLKTDDIYRFLAILRAADLKSARRVVLDDRPGGPLISTTNEEGSFVLLPADGTGDILKTVVQNVFEDTAPAARSATAPVRVEIQNGTTISGLAYETSLLLREKGFAVISYGNAPRRDYVKSVIYDYSGGGHERELRELAALLDAEIATTIPTWMPVHANGLPGTAIDFVVIVGKPGDNNPHS